MVEKLSRNAPCPCGSGNKIKRCCGERARTWKPIDFGSFQLAGPVRVQAIAQTTEESPVAHWLIDCARQATLKAKQSNAVHADVLVALLLTVTAAEAVVNRLLEALVSPAEWEGNGSRAKPVERLPLTEKWEKLSKTLALDPPFRRGEGVLQAFQQTLQARHDLIHFKHGKNAKVFEARGAQQVVYDVPMNIDIDPDLLVAPKEQVARSSVEDSLQPSRAEGYYLSFAEMLVPVLNACPTNDPSLAYAVDKMRNALGVVPSPSNAGRPPSLKGDGTDRQP
jgi:hypothetical protein